MPYTNQVEIESSIPADNLIQLTDDDESGSVDATVIDNAIAWADSVIDSYLRARYEVPIASPEEIIVKISTDLAIVFLYERRFETEYPEGIKDRRKNALDLLGKIQAGTVSLNIDLGTGDDSGSAYRTNKTAEDRLFSWDNLDMF